ncbi:hypothetical protein R0K05_21450, partial [Planococcus sp. SIMBA_160]
LESLIESFSGVNARVYSSSAKAEVAWHTDGVEPTSSGSLGNAHFQKYLQSSFLGHGTSLNSRDISGEDTSVRVSTDLGKIGNSENAIA